MDSGEVAEWTAFKARITGSSRRFSAMRFCSVVGRIKFMCRRSSMDASFCCVVELSLMFLHCITGPGKSKAGCAPCALVVK